MGLFKKNKFLLIAEKPAVAYSYATALEHDFKRKDGYLEGTNYIITWTLGHICTLYEPEDYDEKYKKWTFDDLPIIPNGHWIKVRDQVSSKKQFRVIKDLIKREDVKEERRCERSYYRYRFRKRR